MSIVVVWPLRSLLDSDDGAAASIYLLSMAVYITAVSHMFRSCSLDSHDAAAIYTPPAVSHINLLTPPVRLPHGVLFLHGVLLIFCCAKLSLLKEH